MQIETPIGPITITVDAEGRLTHLRWGGGPGPESAAARRVARQLRQYFSRARQVFDLPLAPAGTDFQRRVWRALQTIRYGTTCSYSDVAEEIGNPNASRAVGQANGNNPIPIIIPCHRVIAADGSLCGYSSGLARKRRLLALEGWRG